MTATTQFRGKRAAETTALLLVLAAAHAAAQDIGGASVKAVARSPDGSTFACLSNDGGVRLFDAAGKPVAALAGHTQPVNAVVFSPDGKHVATAADDRTVRLWNARTGEAEKALEVGAGPAYAAAFSPSGARLAAGVYGGVIVFDLAGRKSPISIAGLDGAVRAVIMPGETTVVAAAGGVRVWELSEENGKFSARVVASPDPHGAGTGSAVNYEPPPRSALSYFGDWVAANRTIVLVVAGGIIVYVVGLRLLNRRQTRHCEWATLTGHEGPVNCVAMSPDGTVIATGGEDRLAVLWDPVGRRSLHVLRGHSDSILSTAFSHDGRLLATGGEDGVIRLWSAGEGRERAVFGGQPGAVSALAFSPDGSTLAAAVGGTAGVGGQVRLLEAGTGAPIRTLAGHLDLVEALAFSPDGSKLATGSRDKTVKLWDWRSGFEQAVLKGHTDWVRCLAFSPDGRMLATAGWDMSVKRWDVISGGYRGSLHGHTGWIYGIAFSPDGTLIATAGQDKTIRLWSRATGEELTVLTGHDEWVTGVAFAPDGGYLASSGHDKSVKLWQVDVDADKLFRPEPLPTSPRPVSVGFTDVISGEFEVVPPPTPDEVGPRGADDGKK